MRRLIEHLASRLFSPASDVRKRYSAFRSLLEQDHLAHQAMARLERIYHDRLTVDFCAVKAAYEELFRALQEMCENLRMMAPFAYRDLSRSLRSLDARIRGIVEVDGLEGPAPLVMPLHDIPADEGGLVGGKAASLSRIIQELHLPVPSGFVITTQAFYDFLRHNHLRAVIEERLSALTIDSAESIETISQEIVSMVMDASIPDALEASMSETYVRLLQDKRSAVRSSAVGEDGVNLSFAGQYRTLLNVGHENLAQAYKEIIAGRYSPTALSYRVRNGLLDDETPMGVLVMEMIDARASGVLYTLDPVDSASNVTRICSVWGLGESLVGGLSSPDVIKLRRDGGHGILEMRIAEKRLQVIPAPDQGTISVPLDTGQQWKASLDEAGARELARWGVQLESRFGIPQDIEWCESHEGNRFLLQARPLRLSAPAEADIKIVASAVPNRILISGGEKAASGVASGVVLRIQSPSDLRSIPDGAILVAATTAPQYAQLIGKIKGVVTDIGSAAGHFASVAREAGIPCLVNTRDATKVLKDGEMVTLDADHLVVYAGIAEELLSLSHANVQAPTETPFRRRLRRLLDGVSPLHLLDPGDPKFDIENCRTLHDFLRFLHEKAVEQMFDLAGKGSRKFRGAKKLLADIPVVFYVLDLGGGLEPKAGRGRTVSPEDVLSLPFGAFWRGLVGTPEHWNADTLHFDWLEFGEISLGDGIVSVDSQLLGSFALLSSDYMNVNVRFGFHFAIVDALIGPMARDNYVSLRFKGGGADFGGRQLRVLFLAQILEDHGFHVHLDDDSISARIERASPEALEAKLEIIGKLLAFTPCLDMRLSEPSEVETIASVFSKSLVQGGLAHPGSE